MNVRPLEESFVFHFSGAKVDHVDEVKAGILVAYDTDRKIVDIAVRGRPRVSRLDLIDGSGALGDARITYDAEVDALAIDVGASVYLDSEEILPGLLVDYDIDGFVRGLEFLAASRFFPIRPWPTSESARRRSEDARGLRK